MRYIYIYLENKGLEPLNRLSCASAGIKSYRYSDGLWSHLLAWRTTHLFGRQRKIVVNHFTCLLFIGIILKTKSNM